MDFKDRQREAMRLAARIESKAAEANSEAKSAGGKEWEANSEAKSAGGKEREPEFLFFYRCHTALVYILLKFHLWAFLPSQSITLDKFRMAYFNISKLM